MKSKKSVLLIVSIMLVSVIVGSMLFACKSKVVKIGVQAGTTSQFFIEDMKGNNGVGAEAVGLTSPALALEQLLVGGVDAVMVDKLPAQKLLANDKFKDKVKLVNIPLSKESYAAAVPKNNEKAAAVMTKFNKWLDDNKSVVDEILDKFAKMGDHNNIDADSVFEKDKDILINSEGTKTLTVVTNCEFIPFEYEAKSGVSGIDLVLAYKFALDQGYKNLHIKHVDFNNVITELTNSKYDENNDFISLAGLSKTEEREATLTFSKEYTTTELYIIVLKDSKVFDECKTNEDVIKALPGLLKK